MVGKIKALAKLDDRPPLGRAQRITVALTPETHTDIITVADALEIELDRKVSIDYAISLLVKFYKAKS